jgi:Camelysin metallo-endopeptidase
MNRFTKKSLAVSAVAALLLGGGGAYAYWTAGGSGTGSAATGTNVAITAVQTSTVTAMAPGDSAQSLNGTFLNTNSGPVYVATVTASISSVVKDGGAVAGTCDSTDYTLANAVMTINAEALANDTSTWTGATLKFNNKVGANQDQCKLATVNIAYAIS